MRCILLTALAILALLGHSAISTTANNQHNNVQPMATQRQSTYLKEIVMGRCYEHPPIVDDSFSCPFVVDSLLGVLDSSLDADISNSSFDMYLAITNYETAKDTALLVWPPPPTTKPTDDKVQPSPPLSLLSSSWTLPETTLGGALMEGLVFCGVDRRMDCPVEFWKTDDNTAAEGVAMLGFWQGVYSLFAANLRGKLRILLWEENLHEIPSLWKDHVLPPLSTSSSVTSVDIVATNCHDPGVKNLLDSMHTYLNLEAHCSDIPKDKGDPSLRVINAVKLLETGVSDDATAAAQSASTASADLDPPPSPSASATADATSSSNDERQEQPEPATNIYEILFWVLIVMGTAIAYATWSVRHYLPEYQRIPDTNNSGQELDETGRPLPYPKQ